MRLHSLESGVSSEGLGQSPPCRSRTDSPPESLVSTQAAPAPAPAPGRCSSCLSALIAALHPGWVLGGDRGDGGDGPGCVWALEPLVTGHCQVGSAGGLGGCGGVVGGPGPQAAGMQPCYQQPTSWAKKSKRVEDDIAARPQRALTLTSCCSWQI